MLVPLNLWFNIFILSGSVKMLQVAGIIMPERSTGDKNAFLNPKVMRTGDGCQYVLLYGF